MWLTAARHDLFHNLLHRSGIGVDFEARDLLGSCSFMDNRQSRHGDLMTLFISFDLICQERGLVDYITSTVERAAGGPTCKSVFRTPIPLVELK
jgi:hypothetical protein